MPKRDDQRVISVYLDDDVYAQLAATAARERRSINAQANLYLEEAMGIDRSEKISGRTQEPGGTAAADQRPSGRVGAAPKKRRSWECEHRIPAGAYCKTCDA